MNPRENVIESFDLFPPGGIFGDGRSFRVIERWLPSPHLAVIPYRGGRHAIWLTAEQRAIVKMHPVYRELLRRFRQGLRMMDR